MFHDQHRGYFNGNFGGYTTIWNRPCGMLSPKFENGFQGEETRSGEVNAVPEAEAV